MGNDGGSIPRRNEMVREKKQDEKTDRKTQLIAMNYFCALSKQPLREPVVGDMLGRLYNRESILEYLLNPTVFGEGAKICNIKSLKDVKTLNLKVNPAYTTGQTNKRPVLTFDDQPTAPFVCPITRKEMNGNLGFEFVWTCGCVVSTQARKEMAESDQCLVCSGPVDSKDVVPINSQNSEVLDSLRKRAEERALETKKKSKKVKSKRKHVDEPDVSDTRSSVSVLDKNTKAQKTVA
ncbi:Replication termination factor 2 [Coemansia sp. RSA 1878]|nr:Replication termination factor 2 [Coemansia sp. RSA 1878]